MSDEVKTCKDCKYFIADGSSRHGLCELKKSRIDKWGQEVSIRRMASGKACKKAEPAASQSVDDAPLRELETYKQEYRLAAAANRQLADALDKAREENKMLRLQIFAFVRNSAVLPVGRRLNKSEQELSETLDFRQMLALVKGQAGEKLYDEEHFEIPENWEKQHVDVLINFSDAIRNGTKLVAPGSDGIKAVEIADSMYLSDWLGKEVMLPVDDDLFYSELQKRVEEEKAGRK